MLSIYLIETYAYRASKDLASENKEIQCNNIITQYQRRLILMMSSGPEIPDFLHRILIIEGFGFIHYLV